MRHMRFYQNLPDDLHCFQAALKIVLSRYFPEREFSFAFIDKVTGFKKGQFTQDSKGLLWLVQMGFALVRVSDFDDKRFVREGEKYLKWYWRPEIFERNKKNTDFKEMRSLAKALLPHTKITVRKPRASDIDALLAQGYTVMAHINPREIDPKFSDIIHTVVIARSTNCFFFIHNPGLPPQENQKVSKKRLQRALYELVGIRPVRGTRT